jgi:hypothetical protein
MNVASEKVPCCFYRKMRNPSKKVRSTGLLDFVHNPVIWKLENTAFGNWICFHPQVRR